LCGDCTAKFERISRRIRSDFARAERVLALSPEVRPDSAPTLMPPGRPRAANPEQNRSMHFWIRREKCILKKEGMGGFVRGSALRAVAAKYRGRTPQFSRVEAIRHFCGADCDTLKE
jgi:hypothetical protein